MLLFHDKIRHNNEIMNICKTGHENHHISNEDEIMNFYYLLRVKTVIWYS